MTKEEIDGLKKGDLIFYVREVVGLDRPDWLRVESRRIVGVTELNVTTEPSNAPPGSRRGRELVSKHRLGSYSLTPAAAKKLWEHRCQDEVGTAERRVIRAIEALGRAAEFSSRDE